MTERNIALRAKHAGNNRWFQLADRAFRRSGVLALLCGGWMLGVSSHAGAEPPENTIISNCTFSAGELQDALNIPDLDSLNVEGEVGHLEASYIIIYVRQNPNDGQRIGTSESTSYTGPILCTNSATDSISETDEGETISGVNIVGAEEASHLQVEPQSAESPNDREKRVCHTVASKTECFLIQPNNLE